MNRNVPVGVLIAVLSLGTVAFHLKADDASDSKELIGTWAYENRQYVFKKDGKFDFFTTGELQSQSGDWKISKGKLILTYSSFISRNSVESDFTLKNNRFTLKKEPFYYNAKAKLEDVPYERKK